MTFVTRESLEDGIGLAARYLVDAVDPRGQFRYRGWADGRRRSPGRYNIVRHAGAVYAMAVHLREAGEAVEVAAKTAAQVAAMGRAAGYLVDRYCAAVPGEDGLVAVWSDNLAADGATPRDAKLGAAGLGLAALVVAREAIADAIPLSILRGLGAFILYMQRPDGSFHARYDATGRGRHSEPPSLYYPGEAALGLILLARLDDHPAWRDGAVRALRFLAESRTGLDQVPPDHWALIASSELARDGSIDDTGPGGRIAPHAAQVVRSLLRRAPRVHRHSVEFGALFDAGRVCPTAAALEGLLCALDVLPAEDERLRSHVDLAAVNGVQFLLRAQIRSGPCQGGFPHLIAPLYRDDPRYFAGAAKCASRVQIDYVQHALCALMMFRERMPDFARRGAMTGNPGAGEVAIGFRLTRRRCDASIEAATRYLLTRQRPDGAFVYEWNWRTGDVRPDDSVVRQSGAAWALAIAGLERPSPELRAALERAIGYFSGKSRLTAGGGRYIVDGDPHESGATGAIALCALTLIDLLRVDPGDEGHRRRLDECIRFLLECRTPGGLWHRSYSHADGRPFGEPSPYFDGETLLALARAARHLGMHALIPVVRRGAEAAWAEHVVSALGKQADSSQTVGFFHWGIMAYFELAHCEPGDADLWIDRVFALADWMIDVRRPLGKTRNTSYAMEGLIHAYALARSRGDLHRARRIALVVDSVLSNLGGWQVGGPNPNAFIRRHSPPDERAIGGVQNEFASPWLRIDVTQHQLHATILARNHLLSGAT